VKTRRRTALYILAAILIAPVASAQSQPRQAGQWLPWKSVPPPEKPGAGQVVSPDELASFDAELRTLREIVERAPGMSMPPAGFDVTTSGQLLRDRGEPDAPIAGVLMLTPVPAALSRSLGTLSRKDYPHLDFAVNWLPRRLVDVDGYMEDWHGVGTDAGRATEAPTEFAGFERYGEALVIMPHGAPLWTALGLGDALDLVRASRQLDVEEFQDELKEMRDWNAKLNDSQYRAEFLRRAREEVKNEPNPEEALAAIVSEVFGLQDHMDRSMDPELIAKEAQAKQAPLAEVTAWLAALSPGERDAPACFVEGGKTLKDRFLASPRPDCVDLVRPNPVLFDPARPRTVPQVLTIGPIDSCIDPPPGASEASPSCAALRALIETLDKEALRAWLQ
jgi:hypothetical protein